MRREDWRNGDGKQKIARSDKGAIRKGCPLRVVTCLSQNQHLGTINDVVFTLWVEKLNKTRQDSALALPFQGVLSSILETLWQLT